MCLDSEKTFQFFDFHMIFFLLSHFLNPFIISLNLKSIEANVKVGNITQEDATQLLELTRQLYEYLYDNYYEIGGCEDMKPLLDGAMELPLDKYRIRIDELEGELASEKERADKMSVEAERLRKELEELKKNK